MTDPIETEPQPLEQVSIGQEAAPLGTSPLHSSSSNQREPEPQRDSATATNGSRDFSTMGITSVPAPAGFLRRALAFVIDLCILNLLYCILALFGVFGISMASEDDFMSWPLDQLAVPFLSAGILLFIGYFTFFHAMEGQTPAKKFIRIKVVKADGGRLSHGTTFLRCSLGYFLSFYSFGFGFLMALFGSKKRALHDFLTGSYVVLSGD